MLGVFSISLSRKRVASMTEPGRDDIVDQYAKTAAHNFGLLVAGRELTGEEIEAMTAIFKATGDALREGFIKRLAEHVRAERDTETVEEFFEDIIKPT